MATINLNLNVPDEIIASINTWRSQQLAPNGSVLYPTNQVFLRTIIKQKIREILEQFPTAEMRTRRAAVKINEDAIEVLKESSVT